MKIPWVVALLCGLSLVAAVPAAQAQAKGSAPAAKPELVLLDTDIGDDIDDAFALGLMLKSSELKVLGITTTFGDTELRARLLDRFLAAAGRSDIPVGAGPATKNDNVFTQAAYAKQAPAKKHADGVALMLNAIRAHPGEVTLIAIGPLFTVQAAIEKDPGTFRKLKRVVLMGGSVERGYDNSKGERQPPAPEWNIDRDPKGAQALFAAGVPIAMMPLDSTQIHLETKERERIFAHGSAVTDQITLLYHQWMAGSEWHTATPTLFDPVTVAYVLHPELCPTKPMRIEVDEKGMTRAVDGKPNAEVCLASDEKGFMELLLNRLTGQEK